MTCPRGGCQLFPLILSVKDRPGAIKLMLWPQQARHTETKTSPCTGRLGSNRCRGATISRVCARHCSCPKRLAYGIGELSQGGHTLAAPQKWELWPGHRERPFPTFQRLLQGLGKAGHAVAVTVILAWIFPPREGQGCQVKVHKGQVITSHLHKRAQRNRGSLRCLLFPVSLTTHR